MKLMDKIGPAMNYVLDRRPLFILVVLSLITLSCFLQLYGGIVMLFLIVLSGFYIRWSLVQELNDTLEEDEFIWPDSSKRHA